MGVFRRKRPKLPFAPETYENALDLFLGFLGPEEFGPDPEEDPRAARFIEVFQTEGLNDPQTLSTVIQQALVETKQAHDVTRVLARACVDLSVRDSSPASWLASEAADITSRHAPIARGNKAYAVNRAERVVLESACATFLSLLELEGLIEDSLPGADAAAQATGLLLAQWYVWNQPYAFAAFNKKDGIP